MDKSRGSSNEALSGSKRHREESPGSGVGLAYEAELRSKLEAGRVSREVEREREAWAAGTEWLQREEQARSATGSGAPPPGSGGGVAAAPDPWEVAASAGAGGSSSSAPRPALARGPVAPPRQPPRSFAAGATSRPSQRFGSGSSSMQFRDRHGPPSGPSSASAVLGDGILPPPPPLLLAKTLLPQIPHLPSLASRVIDRATSNPDAPILPSA